MKKNKNLIKNKQILLKFIKGYKRANKVIFKENLKKLINLSVEEAFLEYKNLCKLWDKIKDEKNLKKIENLKIENILKRRKILNRLGNFKN